MTKWLMLTAWDSSETKPRLCFGAGGVIGYARMYRQAGEPFTQLWSASEGMTWQVSESPEEIDAMIGVSAELSRP